jgi:hypothetical protein
MSTDTLARSAESTATGIDIMGFMNRIKDGMKKMPLPVQLFMNLAFAGLLAIDLVIVDGIPLIDELLLGWLLYAGMSASADTIRGRRRAELDPPAQAVDVRDQQGEPDYLKAAAEAEVEAATAPPFP